MHILGIGSNINLGNQFVTVVNFRAKRSPLGDIIGCTIICKDNRGKTIEISNSQVESAIK